MSDILINQSVAILCDGNNIERSIHEMSKNPKAMINFDQLIPKLLDGRGLNRLIYFREGNPFLINLPKDYIKIIMVQWFHAINLLIFHYQ